MPSLSPYSVNTDRIAKLVASERSHRIDSVSGAWRSPIQRQAKANLFVQQAVFVANHETRLGIIFGDQQPQPARILGHVENRICGVGLAGPQGLCQGQGSPRDSGKGGLTFR